MGNKTKTYISLDAKTYERIKLMAKADNRTVANYIDTVLREYVEQNYVEKTRA